MLLLSGAIHYPRSTPAMWSDLMKRSREAGINTIETYVFWNHHERQRGVFDFSGRLDLMRYLQLAQEHGLHVILRIGPYICAETNYGGFPAWLRDLPGVRMRTYNEPFMREMARWSHFLCDYIRPMLAPNGGPIILAQFENEYESVAKLYGDSGKKYLPWAAKLGSSLNLGIPLIMCFGGTDGVIETINDLHGHEWLDKHFAGNPGQPALWTEAWTGWYNTYSHLTHVRAAESMAYAAARFFAGGGTGINYYMWHGGTNFNRESMYLQTTCYDFNAPLDEFGLPTTKSCHLGQLHRILADYADVILGCDRRPMPQSLGPKQAANVYGSGEKSLTFLCNDGDSAVGMEFESQKYNLQPRSVLLVGNGRILMDTAKIDSSSRQKRSMQTIEGAISDFAHLAEPTDEADPVSPNSEIVADEPIEQLKLTHDETDYCWYRTDLEVPDRQVQEGELKLEGVGDVVHIFVDGQLAATTATPLSEFRGPVDGDGFTQKFRLKLEPGSHELLILCCAMGLIKHECQLGQLNMAEERKGFWGKAYWEGNIFPGPWKMQPGLAGERQRLYTGAYDLVQWESDQQDGRKKPLRWWRTTFDRPDGNGPFALDLTGMNKGLAWLNGHCIGRYWLTPAVEPSEDFSDTCLTYEAEGQPTQRYYHLPHEWVADHNILVLFEELGGDPQSVQLCRWA